jgi:hypothetical protein
MMNMTAGKEERGTDACTVENPDGLAEARELLRPLYQSREFWLLILDAGAMAMADRIAGKYYPGAPVEDFAAIPAMVNGAPFVAIAARKRKMLAWQLNSLLRQMARVRMTDREAASRDLIIAADPRRLEAGTHLAVALFDDPAAERGDARNILTVDGRLPMAA